MRKMMFASLFLIPVLAVACAGDGDDGDTSGDGGSSVGASTGSGGSGMAGGSSTGGSTGDSGPAAGCGTVTVATGSPTLIEDFEDLDAYGAMLPNDGRAGAWGHAHNLNPAGSVPETPDDTEASDGKYARIYCEAGNAADYPWCNTPWETSTGWGQWASLDALFGPYVDPSVADPNCYDASMFTGIKFKARSGQASGDKIYVKIMTPDANLETGEWHTSDVLTLGATWEEFSVPFTEITPPSWSTLTALDPSAIISMSFVVRTVTPKPDDGEQTGEQLEPYDIHIDNVEFY